MHETRLELPFDEWEAACRPPADPREIVHEQEAEQAADETRPFPWTGPPAPVALPHYPMGQTPLWGSRATYATGVQDDAVELVRIMLGAPAAFRLSLRTTVVAGGSFEIHWGAGNGSDIWTRANTTTIPENVDLAAQWIRVLWRPASPVVAHDVVACGAILNG